MAAHAQEATWHNQDFKTWLEKVDGSPQSEIFGERYTAAQVQWVIYGIFAFFIHQVFPEGTASQCVDNQNIQSCIDSIKSYLSPIGLTNSNNLQAKTDESFAKLVFADRPLSGISYVRNRIQNMTIVPVAHAQEAGFGFQALEVIQDLWASMRNIAYSLFVLIAIILSFMIMFRVKVNPQTIITIQSAIPKLIIALVLVTFSYAIAGFVIDFMYLIIGLFSLILANTGNFFLKNPVVIFKFLTSGYIGMGIGMGETIGISTGILGPFIIYLVYFPIILFLSLTLINGSVAAAIGTVLTLGAYPAIMALISIIAFVVLFVILIFNYLKIMWMLIKAFAKFLLTVVFGPFQIALGVVVPGMGFGSWLKSLLSNLAIFPTTGVLLAMSFVFLKLAEGSMSETAGQFKILDLLGVLGTNISTATDATGWPPFLSGPRGMLSLIYLGVSFIFITLIPKVTEIIQGFITGRPFAYGTAIGEAFGPARAAWGMTGAPLMAGIQKETAESIYRTRRTRIEAWLNRILPGGSGVNRGDQTPKA